MAIAAAAALFALDRGVLVGTEVYVTGASCCPADDMLVKHCKYLFVTGISELLADEGITSAPNAMRYRAAGFTNAEISDHMAAGKINGFCHILARPTAENTLR